ncbi:hypothetical protein P167DRAFT_601724 [Morchella conica CCBAS932]|uniref:Uncharacterized protein n=1 Tax=Morchella conica CCBAS932 TaxID=1392247 RepID=A0A3N4L5Z9_9PEZI|nr:hypothetical protein P167DRAFT_601724 [Morchella conica CCBAS932]
MREEGGGGLSVRVNMEEDEEGFAGRGWGLATAENTVESVLVRASKQPESDGSGISL